jgi:preprotein translocase subunit SecF
MRIFANANYNFLKWRWHALIASIVIIWIGVASMYVRGMRWGIEFTGGTQVILKFQQPTDEQHVRRAIDTFAHDAVVQTYGPPADHQILVRIKDMPGQGSLDSDAQHVRDAVTAANLGKFDVTTNIVGPVVGEELRTKGLWATVLSLGGILVYVMFRFRLTFAIGAVVAAFHDILITLVFLSWFQFDITLNIIAAILTITGYSVNDTIVVFDRVRENQRLMRREPLDKIINTSVTQTLGRTIITSSATFLAVLSLYLFGGEVLRGFAFTMLIGVITGTYSTVFIAAAIAMILSRQPVTNGAPAAPARAARRA